MKKVIYSFIALYTIFFTASCSSGEYDKAIKDACVQVRSDMPERYTIIGGELITYCYNPDMGEWVNMGSYYQVY